MKQRPYFWLFPRKCLACGRVIDAKLFYCDSCRAQMPFIEDTRCEYCGCGKEICTCNKKQHHYDGIVAPFYYEKGAKHAILKLKRYPIYAEPLAKECTEGLKHYYGSILFDSVCAVPMGKSRLKQSGFNHSAVLGKEIARQIGAPYRELLVKVGKSAPQHELGLNFRAGNVRGMYDIIDEHFLKNKTILLVDDIKTTGATLDECALMLKLGGAAAVYVVCVGIVRKTNDISR